MSAAKPKITAMVYCCQDDQILLMQRRKPPFVGQWIAPGGKVEYGEAPWQTAIREIHEETGLIIASNDLSLRGIITETSPRDDWQWLMFAYTARRFTGELIHDCPEGELRWWPVAALADLDIPAADKVFTTRLLAEHEPVYQGRFVYDNDLELVEVMSPHA